MYERQKDEGVLEGFEIFVGKVNNFARENKVKVGELEQEMEDIGRQIDQRQEELAAMKEQFEQQEEEK